MTSRIVLDNDTRAIVDQIQGVTKASSPSQAIALLVSRYAKHLLGTWELDPARYADPDPRDYPTAIARVESRPHPIQDFRFEEPLSL